MNIETAQRTDEQNLPKKLELALGHEYDFVINLDTLDGITNGTPCFVQMYQENSSKGDLVWVDPRDESIGKSWKQSHSSLYAEGNLAIDYHAYPAGIPNTWLPIPRYVLRHSGLHFTRKQFPLRPSKARTVNRTQGATLEKIVVDFSDVRKGTEHCHYVAFSRCPKKSNVFIQGLAGFGEKKISHDGRCIQEMERLRRDCQLSFTMPSLYNMNEFSSIVFMNAQSLCAKLPAIQSDWNIKGSLVFGVADTRFEPSREQNMNGFDFPPCFYSNIDRPSLGIAVYNKIAHQRFISREFFCNNEIKASLVLMEYPNFDINGIKENLIVCFLYVLPSSTNTIYRNVASYLKSLIQGNEFVIMGDFNRNPERLQDSFGKVLGVDCNDQKINVATHNLDGTIDLIYTNIDNAKCGVLNSLTKTDHRPIFISIPKGSPF